MNKSNLKYLLLLVLLILFFIPIITSSLLDLEKKRENEIISERILAEQRAQKIAWEVAEKNYLMGKFDPAQKENFVIIPATYYASTYKMYLRKETYNAFLQMQKAAEKDKIDLKIVSATRNFDSQKFIWNGKWNGTVLADKKNLLKDFPNELERFKKILEYSAVPGTSRHHWGTDIDINDSTPPYFDSEKGEAEYAWLVKNAPLFGSCQPYTLKGNMIPTGYFEEKWHWSYKPLSKNFTEEYKNLINEKEINGFLGDQYVVEQDIINDYILGINPDCL